MTLKVCTKCGVSKDVATEFYIQKRRNLPYAACKGCTAEGVADWKSRNPVKVAAYSKRLLDTRYAAVRRKIVPQIYRTIERRKKLKEFGKPVEWWQETFDAQGGVCAICRCPEATIDDRTGKLKSLAIDHDHATNQVRGLLCVYCNTALHNVERSPNWPARAAAYLRRFRPDPVEIEMQLPFDI